MVYATRATVAATTTSVSSTSYAPGHSTAPSSPSEWLPPPATIGSRSATAPTTCSQNGHPAAFGVPRGALIGGKPAPHANLFVIKWHYLARYLDPDTGILVSNHDTPGLMERTLRVGWTQFRLNDAGDDLEIVAPAQQLRQVGYEPARPSATRHHQHEQHLHPRHPFQ